MSDGTLEQTNTQPGVGPAVSSLVASDIINRMKVGIDRYGEALKVRNGRNALVDAYQEALDLTVYLKQELIEAKTKNILQTVVESYEFESYENPLTVWTPSETWNDITYMAWNGRNLKCFKGKDKNKLKLVDTLSLSTTILIL